MAPSLLSAHADQPLWTTGCPRGPSGQGWRRGGRRDPRARWAASPPAPRSSRPPRAPRSTGRCAAVEVTAVGHGRYALPAVDEARRAGPRAGRGAEPDQCRAAPRLGGEDRAGPAARDRAAATQGPGRSALRRPAPLPATSPHDEIARRDRDQQGRHAARLPAPAAVRRGPRRRRLRAACRRADRAGAGGGRDPRARARAGPAGRGAGDGRRGQPVRVGAARDRRGRAGPARRAPGADHLDHAVVPSGPRRP